MFIKLKSYFYLLQLPLLASTTSDIVEVFLVKHSMICNQIGRFNFSSKALRHTNDEKSQSSQAPQQQLQRKTVQPQRSQSPNRTVHNSSSTTLQLYLPSSPTNGPVGSPASTLERSNTKHGAKHSAERSNGVSF